MRIRRFAINNLFGMFNHDILLKTNERVTIIHGPNGVGKTTILRLLSDLFAKRFQSIRTTPYDTLNVVFEAPSQKLSVERLLPDDQDQAVDLKFILSKGKKKHEYITTTQGHLRDFRRHVPASTIAGLIDSLERVGTSRWLDHSNGEILNLDEVYMRYGEELPFDPPSDLTGTPDWLREVLDGLPTHFIETQRLFAIPPIPAYEPERRFRTTTATVEKYSQEMTERIQQILRQSAGLAASLDRTFPQRLLESEPSEKVTEQTIRERYEQQAEYRTRLMDAGLIDPEEPVALPLGELDQNARRVLWHYLNDVQEKFLVFDDLLKRVELFEGIINSRFLYKSFAVDKERGFIFSAERGGHVPLRALSSGEQHELVLAFDLLFRVNEGSLILIDEPELSLHVTWQHKFLEDIARISELANLDFIVATHSPSIIHGHSDLMIPLGEQQ